MRVRGASVFALLLLLLAPNVAKADWFNSAWPYRRPLDVNWDAANAEGDELATAAFYTAGHAAKDGSDVRVVDADGTVLPSRILGVGPGDFVRLVFPLKKDQSAYFVYFGNAAATPPPPATRDLPIRCGVLLEMHEWPGGSTSNGEELQDDFERGDPIGAAMVDRPFYGLDPFGNHRAFISKYSGLLSVPVDGEYEFAGAAQSVGAIFIDGRPTLFVPGPTNQVRFKTYVQLTRGRHDFAMYDACFNGDGWVTAAWKRPDMERVDAIDRSSFGVLSHAQPGPLEHNGHTLTADFDVQREGECFVEGNYSQRYLFTAHLPQVDGVKAHWEFGDGTTATGDTLEHIYVTNGIYPIRITYSAGPNVDQQTTRFSVNRDFEHLDNPDEDQPGVQSKILDRMDVSQVPSRWLPWMLAIHEHAENNVGMLIVADRLAAEPTHANPDNAYVQLQQASHDLLAAGGLDADIAMWDRVPANSDLEPRAARLEAQALLWWAGDVAKAMRVVTPFMESTDTLYQRTLGETLVLNGRVDEGKKVLRQISVDEPNRLKLAAISGAMARTIEFRIDQHDWDDGEAEWERWELRDPAVFLQGYSVLLRTELMQVRHANVAAAKIAEAFAKAVPDSTYAPTLLDHASRLLARSDPQKSKELRDLLKDRYPEDPLSQDAPAR